MPPSEQPGTTNGAGGDIFVISDLHIGDGGRRDNFEANRKTPELRAFLDHVGSEGGELFILGDLFELWQMNLSLMLTRRLELLDHFARVNATFVPGNHDVDLLHFVGTDLLNHPFFRNMRAPFARELGGRRFRFFHGHETDPLNSGDDPSFGRMLSIFGGVFEDENGSPLLKSGEGVEDVLEEFGESMLLIWQTAMATLKTHVGQEGERGLVPRAALTPAQNPGRLGEHISGVQADLERGHYAVAVLGHTHQPGRIGNWYFNSGTWVRSENPFLRISADGHVRYFEWKKGCAVEQAVPVIVPDASSKHAEPSAPPRPFRAAISAAKKFFPQPLKAERNRLILLFQGVLALAVGIATLAVSIRQGSTAGWKVLVTAFGGYALLDGALSLLGSSGERPVMRILTRLRGLTSLVLALLVFRRGLVAEIFVVLFGLTAFLSGALRVTAARMFRIVVDSRWLLVVGIGSMLLGLVFLLFPTTGPLLKYVVALYLVYYGLGEVVAALFGARGDRTTESFVGAIGSSR